MSVVRGYGLSWGNPAEAVSALIVGVLGVAIAVAIIIVAVRKHRWWKRNPDSSIAPWCLVVCAIGVMVFAFAAIKDFTRWIDGTDAAGIAMTGWLTLLAGIAVDRLRLWVKAGFPILARCDRCGSIRDFKMGRHRCKGVGRGFEVIRKE